MYVSAENMDCPKGRILHTSSPICHSAFALLLFLPAFILIYGCQGNMTPDIRTTSRQEDGSASILVKSGLKDGYGMNTVDVFIFNDDGMKRLDSYQRLAAGIGNTIAAASRPGDKIVVAISNPQVREYEWNSISSFETISDMYADLRLEDISAPVMCGIMHVTAGENDIHELEVEPLMSEICIRSIRCDFTGRPYSGAVLKKADIYLANVNTLARIVPSGDLAPAAPMNTDGLPDEALYSMEHPETVYAGFDTDIGSQTLYPDIRLYCYPNSCTDETAGTPFTRLVISGEIEGKRYYYPLNINKGEFGPVSGNTGIGRNCRYLFDITIRKTGSLDPLYPVSPETVVINAAVEPWNGLAETVIEF